MKTKTNLTCFILISSFILSACYQESHYTDPLQSSNQSILVLTDSLTATKGDIYTFERQNSESNWNIVHSKIPVVLGRNGLGWGKGLHDSTNIFNYPIKREGDGRSPAGVFNLSLVFGTKPDKEFPDLKMPYLQISESIECIDDINSRHYNQIISREELKPDDVDWESSEKMYFYGIYYELGVFIDHNCKPSEKGYGSCIFLHNWDNPNETMAGCTAMHPQNMLEIVNWLNINKQPALIQMTQNSYFSIYKQWKLPGITSNK